jgi:hypothetical protein
MSGWVGRAQKRDDNELITDPILETAPDTRIQRGDREFIRRMNQRVGGGGRGSIL